MILRTMENQHSQKSETSDFSGTGKSTISKVGDIRIPRRRKIRILRSRRHQNSPEQGIRDSQMSETSEFSGQRYIRILRNRRHQNSQEQGKSRFSKVGVTRILRNKENQHSQKSETPEFSGTRKIKILTRRADQNSQMSGRPEFSEIGDI